MYLLSIVWENQRREVEGWGRTILLTKSASCSFLSIFDISIIQLVTSTFVGSTLNHIIALGYGLGDRGSRFLFPAGTGNFFLPHRVKNASGAHPASYSVGTRGSFPGANEAEA